MKFYFFGWDVSHCYWNVINHGSTEGQKKDLLNSN